MKLLRLFIRRRDRLEEWVKFVDAGLDVPGNAYPWGGSRRVKRMWRRAYQK